MASVSVPKSSSIPRSCLQNSGSKSMEIVCRDHCLMHGVLFLSLSGAQLLWAYPSMLIVLNPSASSLPVSYAKGVIQGWGICKASPKVDILCAFPPSQQVSKNFTIIDLHRNWLHLVGTPLVRRLHLCVTQSATSPPFLSLFSNVS